GCACAGPGPARAELAMVKARSAAIVSLFLVFMFCVCSIFQRVVFWLPSLQNSGLQNESCAELTDLFSPGVNGSSLAQYNREGDLEGVFLPLLKSKKIGDLINGSTTERCADCDVVSALGERRQECTALNVMRPASIQQSGGKDRSGHIPHVEW